MDYQEKATILRVCSSKKGERCSRCPAFGQGSRVCMRNAMKDAASAITELLPYKEAIDKLGAFGALFLAYNGDPRGPIGRAGNEPVDQEALFMDVVTDVDGGVWRPVQESVLQDLLKQLDFWKKNCFDPRVDKVLYRTPFVLGNQTVLPKMQVAFRFEDEVSKPSEDQWSWIMGRFMKGE